MANAAAAATAEEKDCGISLPNFAFPINECRSSSSSKCSSNIGRDFLEEIKNVFCPSIYP